MAKDWSPRALNGLAALTSSSTANISGGEYTAPAIDVPEVGDTVRLIAHQWGSYDIYREGQAVPAESKIIECEVKAIKSVKVTFE